ncbi:MAG: alpha-amylase family glycosyl hydrolase [Oscillospiraceae bacterium]|nr:alpha-amylase family glycosyl hydrolase [Oscillospiraceae bacterium]
MWYHESIFYQIYPLGFCGAPNENDGVTQNRINKVAEWIPHMNRVGINTIYFCPVFESGFHGYDTRDFTKIDCRLGSNADFKDVLDKLREAGIRVVLDGVFNHVGRGFWAFLDVLENRQSSPYKDWFYLDFGRDSNYGDGLWYEGWEGHYDLVKLNLNNPQVVEHLLGCVRGWIEEFGIDGLRLDVAYMLNEDFMRKLHNLTKSIKQDFFLVGEAIHGDYRRIVNGDMLDSCTNYECFKGIFSSFNDKNMFEIAYSLNRQFGPENWTLYKGLPLFNFVDNHDVNRIASNLSQPDNLMAAFGLLFAMPGIPCIYYGSEWGAEGVKERGSDAALRACFPEPIENEITKWIASLADIRKNNPALMYGGYHQLYVTNLQYIFAREHDDNRVVVAINADAAPYTAEIPLDSELVCLSSGTRFTCTGSLALAPNSAAFYRMA